MTSSPSARAGRWLVLASAVLFSLSGAGIKACGFGPWQLGGFRALIAALTLLVFVPEARRHWSWRLLPAAGMLAAMHLSYVLGVKHTTAANTIFIQSSAPVWILLASPWLLREPIRGRDVLTILVAFTGLALFFVRPEAATALSPDIVAGNLIALVSGVFWAGTVLGIRALRGRGAEASVAMGNLIAFGVSLPVQLLAAPGTAAAFVPGPAHDWAIVLLLGTVQSGLAYFLFTRALRTVPATQASLLALLEPVINPLWVFLLFRTEHPGPMALLGGALVLGGVVLEALAPAQKT